jgi:hypothetical protein
MSVHAPALVALGCLRKEMGCLEPKLPREFELATHGMPISLWV